MINTNAFLSILDDHIDKLREISEIYDATKYSTICDWKRLRKLSSIAMRASNQLDDLYYTIDGILSEI